MRKTLTFALLVAWFSICLVGGPAHAGEAEGKVTICHRTNADNTPYVKLEVARNAVDGVKAHGSDHYGEHQGPVYSPGLKATHTKWGDIIPPVDGFHDGLNWTADGQAIYDNGCAPVSPETPETPEEPKIDTPVVIVRSEPVSVPAEPVTVTPAFTG